MHAISVSQILAWPTLPEFFLTKQVAFVKLEAIIKVGTFRAEGALSESAQAKRRYLENTLSASRQI
mgnify:CR=1 FL=1